MIDFLENLGQAGGEGFALLIDEGGNMFNSRLKQELRIKERYIQDLTEENAALRRRADDSFKNYKEAVEKNARNLEERYSQYIHIDFIRNLVKKTTSPQEILKSCEKILTK